MGAAFRAVGNPQSDFPPFAAALQLFTGRNPMKTGRNPMKPHKVFSVAIVAMLVPLMIALSAGPAVAQAGTKAGDGIGTAKFTTGQSATNFSAKATLSASPRTIIAFCA